MMQAPLVYAIGLDSLTARAISTDLAGARLRRLRPLGTVGPQGRRGRRPDLVLVDAKATNLCAELAAVRAAWGENTLIVAPGRCSPFARVWQRHELAQLVEIGPGFLQPLLRQA